MEPAKRVIWSAIRFSRLWPALVGVLEQRRIDGHGKWSGAHGSSWFSARWLVAGPRTRRAGPPQS